MSAATPLLIEMWSDFQCPFCFLGKRKLDIALKDLGFTVYNAGNAYKAGQPFTGVTPVDASEKVALIRYRGFELNPSAPRSTNETIVAHIAKKYGGTEASTIAQMDGMKSEFAKMSTDVPFNYTNIKISNSFDAHRLLHFAQEDEQLAANKNIGSATKERILKAYFTEGQLIGDHAVLRKLAADVGLPSDGVEKLLSDTKLFADAVRADEEQAHRMGIRGVPYFYINNGAATINGAESPDRMKASILKALSK